MTDIRWFLVAQALRLHPMHKLLTRLQQRATVGMCVSMPEKLWTRLRIRRILHIRRTSKACHQSLCCAVGRTVALSVTPARALCSMSLVVDVESAVSAGCVREDIGGERVVDLHPGKCLDGACIRNRYVR